MEFGTVGMISDARLLANYFDKIAGAVTFSDEQKRQIAGLGQLATLKTNSLNPGRITVGEYCSLPEALRYDPVKNPSGARCDVYDHAVNVWGRDAKTGFARRPLVLTERELLIADFERTRLGNLEQIHAAQQRAFAAARRSDQRGHVALRELQIDGIEHTVPGKVLVDFFQSDHQLPA